MVDNPAYPLRARVRIAEGEGIIIARSFDKPMRYDVRLLVDHGKIIKDVTEVTVLP